MEYTYITAGEAIVAYGNKVVEAAEKEDWDSYRKELLGTLRAVHTALDYYEYNPPEMKPNE